MKKIYWFVSTVIILTITTLVLMTYGNPQWGKHVYMWQAYVYPAYKVQDYKGGGIKFGDEYPLISISPENFTGVWRTWYRSGIPYIEEHLVDGHNVGLMIWYSKDGSLFNLLHSKKNVTAVVYSSLNKIDKRSKYAHILKDRPELLSEKHNLKESQ